MLVIHIDTQEDTKSLARIYAGLDAKVLVNPPNKNAVRKAIKEEDGIVVMLGHGSPNGLFSHDFLGYIIDKSFADLLSGKKCIGIWCYASEFAKKCNLKGFFSNMFISNSGEAEYFDYKGKTDEEIMAETDKFCDRLNEFLKQGAPMEDWIGLLKDTFNLNEGYSKFNYEGLAMYD